MLYGVIFTLVGTNLATLLWYFMNRPSKQTRAIQRLIAAFEVEGQTILKIEKLRADDLYLKSPGR